MPDRLVRRINGPRGTGLLAGATLAGAHAVAYTDLVHSVSLPDGIAVVTAAIPLGVYAGLWGLAGVLSLWGAFLTRAGRQRDTADAWGHATLAGMLYVWGAIYLTEWVASTIGGDPTRQWVLGVLYACVGVLVSTMARMTNPAPRG